MGIRMIRQPNSNYKVRSGTNYYSPDDVELTNSLGVIDRDMPASMVNLEYGKINMEYLVSAKDMEKESTSGVYNTVSNIDDIIPFRYAYGGQDGYVVGKGTELNNTIENGKFKIDSGRVVLQGVETDIDANGVSFDIDYSGQKRYYAIYYEVNLYTQSTEIKLTPYSDTNYPVVEYGDDLTTSPTGVSRLELYRFTATNGIIDDIQKVVKPIEYTDTVLNGYDISKGTLEKRLTELGFRQGSISLDIGLTGATLQSDSILKRQGKYVIGEMSFGGYESIYGVIGTPTYTIIVPKATTIDFMGHTLLSAGKTNIKVGQIDDISFYPKNEVEQACLIRFEQTSKYIYAEAKITVNGEIYLVLSNEQVLYAEGQVVKYSLMRIIFGYETN